jgi:hypothetical protein
MPKVPLRFPLSEFKLRDEHRLHPTALLHFFFRESLTFLACPNFQHRAKPRFEMYRTVDVVGLLVSGGCFILALGLAILHRARRCTAGRVVDIQQEIDRILADTTATSVGTSVAPTPAMTVDRAKLLQLREQLDVLRPRRIAAKVTIFRLPTRLL